MTRSELTHSSIIKAARACFLQFGVYKTSMSNIADRAGIARSGVYRYFSSKQELIEAAIIYSLEDNANNLELTFSDENNIVEIIYDLCLGTIEKGRNDKELRSLLASASSTRVSQLIGGENPEAQRILMNILEPHFDRARQLGMMREDISNDEAVEWLRGTLLSMMLRDHPTGKQLEKLIRKFVLPSLIKSDRLLDVPMAL